MSESGKLLKKSKELLDNAEHKQAEEKLVNSLREKEFLLKELNHRVKNNLQIICSMLYLQAVKSANNNLKEILENTQNRIMSIAILHDALYQSSKLSEIDMDHYIGSVVKQIFDSYSVENITLKMDVGKITMNIELATPLGLIINEIVSNSVKHGFPKNKKGTINISFKYLKGKYKLIIKDDGIGFDKNSLAKNEGIGLTLVETQAKQLRADVKLESACGTEFMMEFSKSGREI